MNSTAEPLEQASSIQQPLSFGNLIRKLRLAAGRTLAEAAELSGISVGYISALEHNRRATPSRRVVEKLARAYPQIELRDLLKAAGLTFTAQEEGESVVASPEAEWSAPLLGPTSSGVVASPRVDAEPHNARDRLLFRITLAMTVIERDLEFGSPSHVVPPETVREKLLVIDTYQRATGRILILPNEFATMGGLPDSTALQSDAATQGNELEMPIAQMQQEEQGRETQDNS